MPQASLFGREFDSRQLHLVIPRKNKASAILALAFSLDKIRSLLKDFG